MLSIQLQVFAGWVIAISGTCVLAWNIYFGIRERSFLKRFLISCIGADRIIRLDQLAQIKGELSRRIVFDVGRKFAPRPVLRASALRTLLEGYGFCGENARVAIRVLRIGGLRAHRLYLEGSKWNHVAVELEWNGEWVLFDGHNDPATLPSDRDTGTIPTSQLDRFPNREKELNPWIRASRLNLPTRLMNRPAVSSLRPWPWIVGILENPYLIRGMASVGLIAVGVAIIAIG